MDDTYKRLLVPGPTLPPITGTDFLSVAPRDAYLYAHSPVTDQHQVDLAVSTLLSQEGHYREAQEMTGVPWQLIGAINIRESSGRIDTYLGNGQPLNKKTTLVPAGRGPFGSWAGGAADALHLEGFDHITDWSLERMLWCAHKYNGFGYEAHHGCDSPYVWSMTSAYHGGQYVADGVWDWRAHDKNAGVAAIFKGLEARGKITFA